MLIEAAGFSCATEVDFPPYTADCYIPEAGVIFEVDGAWHNVKLDAIRDAHILKEYNVPTIRFSEVVLMKKGNHTIIIDIIKQIVVKVAEKQGAIWDTYQK